MRGIKDQGIQVYLDDEFVGIMLGIRHDVREVAFLSESYESTSIHCEETRKMKWLDTEKRYCQIPSEEMAESGASEYYRDKYRIPNSADRSECFDSNSIRFSWRVLNVNVETYEEIFDMDEFRPA